MKRPTLYITVPKPCHEKWDSMDATARGAFCHSCQKTVIDFSTMTDREVIEYLQKNKAGCGRFRQDQVDTKLTIAEVDNGIFRWRALALGFIALWSGKNAIASRIYYDQKRIDAIPREIAIEPQSLRNTNKTLQPDMTIERPTDTTVFLPEAVIEGKKYMRDITSVMGMMVETKHIIKNHPTVKASHHNYIETEHLSRKKERKKWLRKFLHLD